MSNTDFGFEIEQDQVPSLGLPEGKFPMQLSEAQRKVSKRNPASWYVEAKFRVIAGNFADKTHIHRYNVGNVKEDVKNRALNEIRSLARAVGYTGKLGSIEWAFGKQFVGEIKSRKGKDDSGNDKIESQLDGYESIGSYSAAPAVNVGLPIPAAVTQPAGVASSASAPWGGAGQSAPWGGASQGAAA